MQSLLRISAPGTLRTLHRAPRCRLDSIANGAVVSVSTTRTSHPQCFSVAPRLHKKKDSAETSNEGDVQSLKIPPSKASRSAISATSLRRVAVEAERSRGTYLRQRGGRHFVDPDAVTKKVFAYCAAERYDIAAVARLVRHDGFVLDPFRTGLYPQVVHVQTPIYPDHLTEPEKLDGHGDVFIFPSGTMVAWNVPEKIRTRLVQTVLAPAAENPFEPETDNLEYLEDPSNDVSSVVGDTIVLGTRSEKSGLSRTVPRTHEDGLDPMPPEGTGQEQHPMESPEGDTILAKIAFSSGLARSTKLQVLETLLDHYFESTRSIPLELSRGKSLPFGRQGILRKTGELLNIRAQLNLYSELTDSLPDIFWDSRHELGLEGYFDNVGRALDVGVRIKVLNEKMDYAQEIAAVLRERLSEQHGTRLEWGIIVLIMIEVLIEFRRLFLEDAPTEEDMKMLREWRRKTEQDRTISDKN
ncbi:hypothetical protein P152DRAFT_462658 [Eremomyces bilateralis CBS 781.70]|uniref:DUF155 domain-containing protein n=1 Tax=Eremomyces bilateralis CBS 781.70 TaxID=1392243 RepID=A0A6G1FRT2_9PEZI|nr:uncharacterized protein P152DRAFT_462658 [Eremomyces bilateralis CBS 781.70]KAF1808379.1 hypothetical protein P152DRAFT_462658 [Eremomyces bilateralis CBS 781.70]